jgi:cytoskeletal protein CcmA (bactofilin family)
MRLLRPLPNTVLALALTAVLTPLAAQAQDREVVSKQVSVGRNEATLDLEFSDRGTLEISLRNGQVLIDGEQVGSFEPGGELDTAWRDLLGRAVSLEDGPLSQALSDWRAPADLANGLADAAQAIDRALEQSLEDIDVQVDAGSGSVEISVGNGSSLLGALLGSAERIGLLPDALSDLGPNVRLYLDEDVDIGEDEVVQGSLVVIDGDITIEGRVDGSVVVVGGSIDMPEGGRVDGVVRLADARVRRNEGTVRDGIVQIEGRPSDASRSEAQALRDQIREDVRREARDAARNAARGRDSGSAITAPFRAVARAAGGLIENIFTVLILGLIGAAAVVFAGDKVDVIAETARRAPGRAAMVGVAGTFLLLPAWILGFVALLVSIIGIPFAIAWLPLFPVAAVLAAAVGYLAVARNTGEWLADSHYPWTGWIRKSNPLITMVGGLVGLMALFAVANVLTVVPFLGFVKGLVMFAAIVITCVAAQIGFGAVILTRGGRRREYWSSYSADEAWAAAMDVDVDEPVATGGEEGKTDA